MEEESDAYFRKEHLKLSTFIKTVHQKLRHKTQKLGFEKAWEMHCSELNMLDQYSTSMLRLATEHWSHNSEVMCRINWIHRKCLDYFFNQGHLTQRKLEAHKMSAYGNSDFQPLESEKECTTVNVNRSENTKLYMLDVGSCYNPFGKFPDYEVLAIDIAPGHKDVKKCDFLTVPILPNTEEKDFRNNTLEGDSILKNSFDVVIFSLLLEYFPCSDLRFKCCEKAYEVLKAGGLLFIITPDSKHATANAKTMKKWRIALATLGFWRLHYEKLKHLHCMTFCKCTCSDFPKKWVEREAKKYDLQSDIENPSELMTIPQDSNQSHNNTLESNSFTNNISNPDITFQLFQELPEFSWT